MAGRDQIARAIGAHGLWKERLRRAIENGHIEVSVDQARVDNACEFGQWLYSLGSELERSEYAQKVRALHAKFHLEAAAVLEFALSGQKAQAQKSMEMGGPFNAVSMELIRAMIEWQKAVQPGSPT